MDSSILNTLISGLMGFLGGLITIPLNAMVSYVLKREELKLSHRLDMIAKKRELLLQHKLDIEKVKEIEFNKLVSRLDELERKYRA